jgi:3-hydroxy acid dehydrogenase / malonic semialdehyde reductase
LSLKGKTILVTGASSGIGRAIAEAAIKEGAHVIAAARRIDRLKELAALAEPEGLTFQVIELDVRDRERVQQVMREISVPDVLVNNAGLSRGLDKLQDGAYEDWDEMLDTNVKGLLNVTRELVPRMLARGSGHIVNIGSIAGHEVYPKGNVYCASKHAVDAITKGLRMDLVDTPLRVTTIDPGLVETEFSLVRFHGDEAKAKQVYKGIKVLSAEDVADSVIWSITRPAHVQVAEIILFPTAQAAAAVAHRE